jgi:hypothetical protein
VGHFILVNIAAAIRARDHLDRLVQRIKKRYAGNHENARSLIRIQKPDLGGHAGRNSWVWGERCARQEHERKDGHEE